MIRESRLKGVYEDQHGRKLFTKSLAPGIKVYDEILVRHGGDEYRTWNPNKSKLAAAIMNGCSQIGIKPGSRVLYLGAASGTTVSHVSDIVENNGFVFAVEFSIRSVRNLVLLSEQRKNIAPVFHDANDIGGLSRKVALCDIVFQDIAQKNQTEIFMKNCRVFLKEGGFGLFCVKARSIDVSKNPAVLYKEVWKKLEEELIVADFKRLDPYEKDHCIFIVKKK